VPWNTAAPQALRVAGNHLFFHLGKLLLPGMSAQLRIRMKSKSRELLSPSMHLPEPIQARASGHVFVAITIFILAVVTISFFNAIELSFNLAQTSDSAQGFVVGHAIAGGNVLLSSWHFPIDSFYFTDSLPYAAAEWIVGSRPFLLALVPALEYALFVILAIVVCVRPAQPLKRNLQSASAIALLLAIPVWIGAWNPLLMSDMHMATTLAAFGALVLCARLADGESEKSSFSAQIGTATGLVLAICVTVASDPFSIVFAFGPALIVLASESIGATRPKNSRFVLVLCAGGIVAGLLLPLVVARAGGFTTENDVTFRFAPQPGGNLLALLFGTLTLSGMNPIGMKTDLGNLFVFANRCTAFALMLTAFVKTARDLFRRERAPPLDRLLFAGILALLAACVPSAQFAKGVSAENMWHGGPPMRFIVPAFLFAAVLTGRQIAGMLDTIRDPKWRTAFGGAVVLSAALMVFVGTSKSAAAIAQPRWIDSNAPTTAALWLERHGLSQGVGEYWLANLVTAMSGNAVLVRSVVPDTGRLVPYVWVEDQRFYAEPPQFAIWHEPNQTGVTGPLVRATYPVCRIYAVAGYWIAVLNNRANPCRVFGDSIGSKAHPKT
jgi:hypothetical protein